MRKTNPGGGRPRTVDGDRVNVYLPKKVIEYLGKNYRQKIAKLVEDEMGKSIADYKPGQKFMMPDRRVVYLDEEMRLKDTGKTFLDYSPWAMHVMPVISDAEAWEYEEEHGQHN